MSQPVEKQATDQGVWLAVAPDGWEWAEWEDGYCLFDAEAGDTHILNELSAALLAYIAEHPRTTDWLCATTAGLCELRADGAWRSKVRAILAGLGELELIELQTAPLRSLAVTVDRDVAPGPVSVRALNPDAPLDPSPIDHPWASGLAVVTESTDR